MPGSKKIFKTNALKNKTTSKKIGSRRSMDIASFKEIRRVEQLEIEVFKAAGAITTHPYNKAAAEEWSGFWSRVAAM